MKRYMICPIIGNGIDPDNSFRASVADVGNVIPLGVVSLIPSKPDGTPKYGFALCAVGATNWQQVLAVTNSYAFPVYPLDGRMDGMETSVRNAMVVNVAAYDMDGQGFHLDASHVDSDSFADVFNRIARQIEPAFPGVHTFDVAEPST